MKTNAAVDYVIIGAGTAGCVMAARLSANPAVSVTLIEAGGEPCDPAVRDPSAWPGLQGSAVDWGFETVAQRHGAGRVHAWPRGRALGGSTCINAMAHVRGHPDDFDGWARAGCAGWGYADLLPYFIASEHSPHGPSPWHGSGGPIHLIQPDDPHPITRAYMEAGLERGLTATRDHNGPRMAGPTVNTLTIRDGRRQTVADAYLTPEVRARPNLAILTGREVARLTLDRTGRCRGVAFREAGADSDVRADRGVILCAGAIGSPVLLLRSGIGPADELAAAGLAPRHDLGGVGRNLHDHLLSGGNVYRSRRPVPPSRYQHSESLMYIQGDGGGAPELVLACVIAPATTEAFAPIDRGTAYTILYGFTHPKSRGAVSLAAADPRVPPRIDPDYLAHADDRRRYLEALDWARSVGGARAMADWRAEELLPTAADLATPEARLDFVQRAAYTHHHPVGTCRMGIDDGAVVDPDLRVRGIEGLHVVDASVIPSIPTGPINAAVVAIAERAGDLIAGRPVLPPRRPAVADADTVLESVE